MVNTIKDNPKSKTNFFSSFFKKSKKDSDNVSTKTGGGAKAFLSKLSGAFLLPISILAIAGLFLGVGATIAGNVKSSAGKDFGEFIKQLGDPLFGALPLLFAAAIAVSFTEEAGVAVFNAIVGYVIFSGLQSVFIHDVKDFVLGPSGEKLIDSSGNPIMETVGYNVLFGGPLRESAALKSIVGNSLGFKTLQTSVFGGIIVGFVVQWAYMRFHTIQLPQFISFFGGKRFVAFAVIILMIPLVFIFLLLWPYIGYAFNWVGKNSGKIPYGFDSFIFGFIERCLVPFGLHHVFYAPLWYTSAGADVAENLNQWIAKGNNIDPQQLSELAKILKGSVGSLTIDGKNIMGIVGHQVVGDSTTSLALLSFNANDIKYTVGGVEKTKPLLLFIQDELGLKIGRFLQGKFSFMQWGLPFAGLAMVMAAPKENRKLAIGVVFPAALTCFVTGVTEPIEFTFLFLAPLMFFGFHAFMCATSFMLMNVLQVHIAQAFSGGFLDLMIYGAIPVLKGTNFWWTIVVGAGYAPTYFFVFYFWIKKANLPTPGRGGNTKLFTKKDYQESKEKKSNVENGAIEPQIIKIIEGYGGKENILKTANCASRLRFDVVDANLVSEEKLKEAGAFGVRRTSNSHVQAIFGPLAEQLKVKIDKALNSKELDIITKSTLESEVSNNTKQLEDIDDLVCEPCADHVCSDNCGCELSDAAKESLLRDNINQFMTFVDNVGGKNNIDKIYRKKTQIVILLENEIQINIDDKFSLFDSILVKINGNQFEFNYETLEKAKEVQQQIKQITDSF